MSNFDKLIKAQPNYFIKNNPLVLKSMFGSTDITPFFIADMEFKIADEILNEIETLVNRGVFAYEFDLKKLTTALVSWYKRRHNLDLNLRNFVPVSGVLTGISILVEELSKAGDHILIQPPVYHQFYEIIKNTHRKAIYNELQIIDSHYSIDFEAFEKTIIEYKPPIFIFCNPHNPVGRVWNREEIEKIIAICDKYGVTIISDEIHCDIIYGNHVFNSITSFESTKHIALLGSPAKTFGMHSISEAFIYINNPETLKHLKYRIHTLYLNHNNALTAYATVAAYEKGDYWVDELVAYLDVSIKWIMNYLEQELPLVKLIKPEGTYQIWLDFSSLNLNHEELKDLIFNKAKIGLSDGTVFGKNWNQHFRMNIASPLSKIKTAFEQLKIAIDK